MKILLTTLLFFTLNYSFGQNDFNKVEIDTSSAKIVNGWLMNTNILYVVDNCFYDVRPNSYLPDVNFDVFHPDSLDNNKELLKSISVFNINIDQQIIFSNLFHEKYTKMVVVKNFDLK